MKKLIFIGIFILIATTSFAEKLPCSIIGRTAEAVMEARQSNVPMEKMIKVAEESDDLTAGNFIKALVIEAYDRPIYNTLENQKKAVTNFKNQFLVECYKNE